MARTRVNPGACKIFTADDAESSENMKEVSHREGREENEGSILRELRELYGESDPHNQGLRFPVDYFLLNLP
jgi:hypothetical protein